MSPAPRPYTSRKRSSSGRPPGPGTYCNGAGPRGAYKRGHWLMLRELPRMVNAEVKAGRDMMDAIPR